MPDTAFDLAAIHKLKRSQEFNDYFLRRVREERARIETDILNGVESSAYHTGVARIKAFRTVENILANDLRSLSMSNDTSVGGGYSS